MNARGRKNKYPLAVCPRCGMDSGNRKVSESVPEKTMLYVKRAVLLCMICLMQSKHGAGGNWMFDYFCHDCGATFQDSRNNYSEYYNCKFCGSQQIEEAEPCEVCGILIPKNRAIYHRCDQHKRVTLEKFKAFLADLSSGEIEYLEDKTDGVYWKEIKYL